MLTTLKASVIGFALITVTAACGDQSVTAPNSRAIRPSNALASRSTATEQQEVTGFAYYLDTPEQNQFVAYAVSAIHHRDGSYSGEVEITSAINNGFVVHGEIACFTIVGNSARLAMRVTRSTNLNTPPGSYLFWSLTDNGEGHDAAPDQTTQFFFGDRSLAMYHCATGVFMPQMFPVLHGNLQVH